MFPEIGRRGHDSQSPLGALSRRPQNRKIKPLLLKKPVRPWIPSGIP